MGNLYQHTIHMRISKEKKCFCINFLPMSCYDRLVETIHQNDEETDEFQAGGFTLAEAKTIHAR